ncbi:putative Dna mismatch repair protein MSH6-1, partial [Cardiosporidium cionae]
VFSCTIFPAFDRHPVLALKLTNFISNDTKMNVNSMDSSTLLVTGPNMGGKSTVLRQASIAIIMAQMGSFVAASRFVLTPIDRLFTRIGANDAILEGKSTFFVELEETCSILTQATKHSFAIIDELGRGTSTFDGTAIAMAALEYIANTIECRCMFSTHFHLLCEEFRLYPNIRNFHMAADVDAEHGNVTFLYRFVEGSCPKSHGMHVARLAGIPDSVLKCAAKKSLELGRITKEFYGIARCRNIARQLCDALKTHNIKAVKELFEMYKTEFQVVSSTH